MNSTDDSPNRIDVQAATARLVDYLRGYASSGGHTLRHNDAQQWQAAAREEFLRRRMRLVTVFDDELLLAIGLGLVDVTQTAEQVWREMRPR